MKMGRAAGTGRKRAGGKSGSGAYYSLKVCLVVILLAFSILAFSTAKSLNVYDLFVHAGLIETQEKTYAPLFIVQNSFGSYGNTDKKPETAFSRSSLYAFVSYSFAFAAKNLLGVGTEYALNILSAAFISVSAGLIYLSSMLLAKRRSASFFGSIMYVLTPYIFFSGINAGGWSMQLMLTSLWLYLIVKGYRDKSAALVVLSSFVLLLDTLVYLSSAVLIAPQIYAVTKLARENKTRVYNFVLLAPVVLLIVYFTLVNRAYPVNGSAAGFVFMALLTVWEAVNGLTIPVFLLAAYVSVKCIMAVASKKSYFLQDIFILSAAPAVLSLSIFHYAPIFNFNPVFPILAVLLLYEMRNSNKIWLLLVVFVFLAPKTVFLYDQFHNYDHPHKLYALWVSEQVANGTVLAGHECPAIKYYTALDVLCDNKGIGGVKGDLYVTSQYFDNENRAELRYLYGLFNSSAPDVGSLLGKNEGLNGKTAVLAGSFGKSVRPMEDNFEFLFSVYPSPLTNIFYYSAFPKAEYVLYKVV